MFLQQSQQDVNAQIVQSFLTDNETLIVKIGFEAKKLSLIESVFVPFNILAHNEMTDVKSGLLYKFKNVDGQTLSAGVVKHPKANKNNEAVLKVAFDNSAHSIELIDLSDNQASQTFELF